MSTCTTTIDTFQLIDGELDVSKKYIALMEDSIGEGSIYERAKDTLFLQFKYLQLNEKEKAGLLVDFMTKFTTSLSSAAMTGSLAWAKEERDGGYALAKVKADTESALANFELIKANVCKTQKETELVCANITKVSGDSIRANGYVTSTEEDGCTVKTLDDTGLLYNQTKQVKGATYQVFADAYRKSGNVLIGVDTNDSVLKGLSGDLNGYTNQQQQNAERQRIAYEDSKVNHAANSSASMIGQMLSAEIAPNELDVDRWRTAVDRLLAKHSTTSTS